MVASGELTESQYMKLVNEVRLPASELSAVVPSFNLDAAKKSFGVDSEGNVIKGGFVDKGGYMGGWYRQGVDVNQEVMAVSEDIKAGKSSLDVDYGMSKSAKEKVEERYKRQAKKDSANPYQGKTMYVDGDVYDYAFMTSLDPMKVETMPPLSAVKENGKVSQEKAVKLGLANAKSIGRQLSDEKEQYAIKNAYTQREIILGKKGLGHSLDASKIHRLRTNARFSAIGAYIVQNAVPINGLKKENPQSNGTYAMACLVNDGRGYVVAIVTVDEFASTVVGIDVVDSVHSVNGRFLAKKKIAGLPQGNWS